MSERVPFHDFPENDSPGSGPPAAPTPSSLCCFDPLHQKLNRSERSEITQRCDIGEDGQLQVRVLFEITSLAPVSEIETDSVTLRQLGLDTPGFCKRYEPVEVMIAKCDYFCGIDQLCDINP
ncbi:MAG TPA: hypothetical protein VLI43_12790 [Gemmatimonadaceae bacterium]|nr:hypothetical protein [Gemmatimonadaceae bacterium]